ncbi:MULTISPECIES: GH1 family beta-glucosidase [unclassified Cryobacterium]|uniref:GH1 family beta-glucosidase n=1 Tax=unclassified Cryobacterium TaxID=2649013 RepID=UPI002B23A482|nr:MULTISPECIES: GH1 family beta-glucosidase [Cryobacterium]MEB0303874.1 GH1 family beta-glucosidase [Cryobacterium sp. 10I1]MEC5148736.1 beta-glucosidase [Cryobacterium psychrotolerans]
MSSTTNTHIRVMPALPTEPSLRPRPGPGPLDDEMIHLDRFPADFAWGLATAAYQIEGAANEGGRGPSIWDTFSHTTGNTKNDDTGDVACDHYHRWPADLDLLNQLGVSNYRLSVSWSRLQPGGSGDLNPEGVAFYRTLLGGLREREIEPYVTLYHWDLPQELEDLGGWGERETAFRFADFAARTVSALGDSASKWITLNEPWCSAFLGYGSGAHAPGRRDMNVAVRAAHHLNLAHGLATAAIRAIDPTAHIGVTNIVTDIVAASSLAGDQAAAARLDAVSNLVFLEPIFHGKYSANVHAALDQYGLRDAIEPEDLAIIHAPLDFAGINHYQRVIAHDDPSAPFSVREVAAQPATTSFGWSVIPESMTAVLLRVAREFTSLPLYVTESGASYHDYVDPNGDVIDTDRVAYLRGYIDAAGQAIAAGVNLKGYFVWSFLDNFEWGEGYSKRFGLVYVDYRTQARIPKLSARWYTALIAAHRALGARNSISA